jgi:hypothetical protein
MFQLMLWMWYFPLNVNDYTYMIFYNKHEKYNKLHCNRAKHSPNPMYPNNFLKNMKNKMKKKHEHKGEQSYITKLWLN